MKMRRCEAENMWKCVDVKVRRCEDEKMICVDVRMRRGVCVNVKMGGCEDEKRIYRPPLLEELFAQTLSGQDDDLAHHSPGWAGHLAGKRIKGLQNISASIPTFAKYFFPQLCMYYPERVG